MICRVRGNSIDVHDNELGWVQVALFATPVYSGVDAETLRKNRRVKQLREQFQASLIGAPRMLEWVLTDDKPRA